jgi:hypothetical protein
VPTSTYYSQGGQNMPDKPEKKFGQSSSTRYQLALAITILVAILAITSIFFPTAAPILDKLLPALMLIIGYFFGQKK